MATPVRLQRYLAAAGVAARRKAEELITAGRVTVNGKVVTTLGSKVDPDHDQVTVDGQAVVPLDYFYVVFNKPKACITAVTDDRGRMTVMDYLPNLPVPVKPVGRLDFYTEGVLLLTNDGELAAKLLAPASHVPKTYHVKVHGQMRPEHVKQLRGGVQLDDGTVTLPAEVEVLPGESKHTWLAITIHEGKHRQIHRMMEALGYYVDKLQRVAFANLTFHHLRVGDGRELTQQELNELRDLVGLDHSAVSRGRWKSMREDTDIPRRARAKAMAEAEEAAAQGEGVPRDAGEDDREDAWEWRGSGQVTAQRAYGAPGDDAGVRREDARGGGSRRGEESQSGGPRRREDARDGRGQDARSGGPGRGEGARGGGPRRGEDSRGAGPRRYDDARGGGPRRTEDSRGAGARRYDDARGGGPRRGEDARGGGSRREGGFGRAGGEGGFGRDAGGFGAGGPRREGGGPRGASGGGRGAGGPRGASGGPRGAGGGPRGASGGAGGGRGAGGPRGASGGPRGAGGPRREGGPRGFGTQRSPGATASTRDRSQTRSEGGPKRGGQGRTFGKRVGAPAGARRGGAGARRGPRR